MLLQSYFQLIHCPWALTFMSAPGTQNSLLSFNNFQSQHIRSLSQNNIIIILIHKIPFSPDLYLCPIIEVSVF